MIIPSYRINISEKIKEYRKKNRLSQGQFGKLLSVSAQAVSKWEQGLCCPDIMILPCLAQILECKTDDFFEIGL
ncbi:MAG: helix-turn-helix transcriptional regulator [Clostridia bacterium]|nr:helix-turn-helix transcriptional regulator [Clostridia bacterium]